MKNSHHAEIRYRKLYTKCTKQKSRRSELASDFCDFFQIFPVQTDLVLMLFLTCRTFPWCSCSVPELSREPPADQEQTAAGSLRNPTARHDLTKSESNNTARQGQPESGPGTTVEVPNQRRTQPEPKPILTERCKTRLKALLCNHGKNIQKANKTRLKGQIRRYRSI